MDLGFQSTIDYGGVGRFTVELLRHLSSYCDQITVYPTPISVNNPTSHPWWSDMPSNIQVYEKKGIFSGLIRDSYQFGSHDVVHINYASFGFPAVLNKILRDVPFVFTHHYGGSPNVMSNSLKYRIEYYLEQSIFFPIVCRSGEVVSVSEYNADRLPKKINPKVIYHGGSTGLFSQTPDNKLEQYDLSYDDNIVLFTGKLHGFKDGRTVVEGFHQASIQIDKDIKLVLATGSGGYDAESVHSYIENNSVDREQIIIIKDVSDHILRTLYEISDILVFPSYAESFGLVFLEAMEAGTPIIHSDRGAAPEVVDDAGIEIEAKNSQECADAIVRVFNDRSLKNKLIKQGYSRRNDFSWEKAAYEYFQIYNRISK